MTAYSELPNRLSPTTLADVDGKVLIVGTALDDVDDIAQSLSAFGINAEVAATFHQAKKTILIDPDVRAVIADIHVQDGGASTALRCLEELPALAEQRSVAMIVVTDDPELMFDCRATGIRSVLKKPIASEDLAAALATDPLQVPELVQPQETIHQLHRTIVNQSRAIARMSNTIKQYERRLLDISNRVDHLTSAAMLVTHRCDHPGTEDVVSLAEYIVTEAAATKDLAHGNRVFSAEDITVN